MKNVKNLIFVLLIGIFVYYIIPIFVNGMSEIDANNFAVLCVLFINSIYAIVSSFILAKLNNFKWYYSIIIGILFIPASLLHYNLSTMIYTLLYILEAMIGSSLYIKYWIKQK